MVVAVASWCSKSNGALRCLFSFFPVPANHKRLCREGSQCVSVEVITSKGTCLLQNRQLVIGSNHKRHNIVSLPFTKKTDDGMFYLLGKGKSPRFDFMVSLRQSSLVPWLCVKGKDPQLLILASTLRKGADWQSRLQHHSTAFLFSLARLCNNCLHGYVCNKTREMENSWSTSFSSVYLTHTHIHTQYLNTHTHI